jgi:hypothetical protein
VRNLVRVSTLVGAAWATHLVALESALGRRLCFDLSVKQDRVLALALVHQAWWFARAGVLSGVDHVMARVKSWATDMRVNAFRFPDKPPSPRGFGLPLRGRLAPLRAPVAMLQYSMAGRALPRGSQTVAERSLKEHKAALTAPALSGHSSFRSSARDWAARWARSNPPDQVPPTLTLTDGGCLEKSRRGGGLAARLVEVAQSSYERVQDYHNQPRPEKVPREAWEAWGAEAALRDQLLSELGDMMADGASPALL